MPLIRLQKYLSQCGVCSRRKGEEHILQGDIKVNGKVVKRLGTKVDPEMDVVEFRNEVVRKVEEFVYIALNKPRGYVVSCHQNDERLVLDLIDIPVRLFPIGRLDKNSTGLLLLTNDGRLHHHISHPSFNHEKEYDVRVANPISSEDLKQMEGKQSYELD